MSKTAKEYLESEVDRLAKDALSLTEKAEKEGRELTEEERAVINGNMTEVAVLKGRVKAMQDHEDLVKAIKDAQVAKGTVETVEDAKTIGEAFVRSEGYKAIKANGFQGKWSTGVVHFPGKLTDAGLSVVSTGDAGGELPLQPQIARGPVNPGDENVLAIAGLFGQGTATQNTIVWLEETTTTPGALSERYSDSDATVTLTAEGAAKPAAFVNFTKRSNSLDKIAAFLPVSDEMLEDEPAIVSYINGRLALFIRQAEDAYLLDELLAQNIGAAAAGDIGGTNRFDAIAAGINDVQTAGGLNPDAILMNPLDFWRMSVSKSAGDGNYFGGSPYRSPQDNPWGVRVVVTNGVGTGTAIVGAFREGATVWRKGGVSVDASNSHEDYFRKNLTALRAEERLALTVYRPGAFSRVSL